MAGETVLVRLSLTAAPLMPNPYGAATRLVSALVVVASAYSSVGCGSSASPSVGTSGNELTSPNGSWTNVGNGIHGTTVGNGPNVLVVYGGYTATDADSEALSLQYVSAQMGALGVGHVYAVRGPQDASYAAREIGNASLAAQLAGMVGSVGFVAVVAHSSGAFVADELFTEASAQVLSKIVYFDLDGGSWALNDTLVGKMAGVYFCNAREAVAGDSANYSSIVSLHADFPASHYYTVDSTGSGCNVGAKWCLHDTLITTRPHNPATFNLDEDYTDFTGARRHVVVAEMQQAMADGVLPGGATPVDAGSEAGGDAGAPPPPSDAGDGSCQLAGQIYASNTCTETLQCDAGAWVARTIDQANCITNVAAGGGCITDTGSVVPQNTCTSTLQCDNGVWVNRADDPASCL
jgi:hypothetical protein